MTTQQARLRFTEVLGLRPGSFGQALVALRGEEDVPPSRFGLSSLKMLRPRVALPLWRGRSFVDRKVLVTNLFNHRQTPVELGWSVKRTQVEDFRGRDMTYDSNPLPPRSLATQPAGKTQIASGSPQSRGSSRSPSVRSRRGLPGPLLVGGRACLLTGPP